MNICLNLKKEEPKKITTTRKLQSFITEHFYKCSNEILSGLGKMYAGGGEFTENINKMGGEGTAEFTSKAIKIFCR